MLRQDLGLLSSRASCLVLGDSRMQARARYSANWIPSKKLITKKVLLRCSWRRPSAQQGSERKTRPSHFGPPQESLGGWSCANTEIKQGTDSGGCREPQTPRYVCGAHLGRMPAPPASATACSLEVRSHGRELLLEAELGGRTRAPHLSSLNRKLLMELLVLPLDETLGGVDLLPRLLHPL